MTDLLRDLETQAEGLACVFANVPKIPTDIGGKMWLKLMPAPPGQEPNGNEKRRLNMLSVLVEQLAISAYAAEFGVEEAFEKADAIEPASYGEADRLGMIQFVLNLLSEWSGFQQTDGTARIILKTAIVLARRAQ